MNCKLTFRYEFSTDGDDFGWLAAHLETPSFGGRNGMWVQWQDIRNFAALLANYPISAEAPLTREWGFVDKMKNYIDMTKVVIAPKGVTGGLTAIVSLANCYEPTNRCTAQFETDYPSLSRFRDEIERMMDTRAGSAILNGSSDVR